MFQVVSVFLALIFHKVIAATRLLHGRGRTLNFIIALLQIYPRERILKIGQQLTQLLKVKYTGACFSGTV